MASEVMVYSLVLAGLPSWGIISVIFKERILSGYTKFEAKA